MNVTEKISLGFSGFMSRKVFLRGITTKNYPNFHSFFNVSSFFAIFLQPRISE